MKYNFKKSSLILILSLVMVLCISNISLANDIYSIDVDVEILENGTGNITQTWQTYVDDGTEFFIPIQNLNHMTLSNISVSNGERDFEYVPNWDIDSSFEEKAYKYGVIQTDEGYEICFGMSERGDQQYIIRFSYENMLQSFPEKDGFNVRFINDQMDPAPSTVSVNIHSDVVDFSEENSQIWAFGYGGNINFENGSILATNTSSFESSNYLNILLGVDKGIFNPSYSSPLTFTELKEEAFEGSSYSMGDPEFENSQTTSIEKPFPWIIFPIILGIVASVFLSIVAIINKFLTNFKKPKLNWSINPSKELPLNGNINANYYFLKNEDDELLLNSNLLVAYLYKWAKEGILDSDFNILKNPNFDEKTAEGRLWDFINKGGTYDNKIHSDYLEEYIEENYSKFSGIFTQAYKEGFDYAMENDLLNKKSRFIFKEIHLTEKGLEEYKKFRSFNNYINKRHFLEDMENSNSIDDFFILSNLYLTNNNIITEMEKNNTYEMGYYPYYNYYIYSNAYRKNINTAQTEAYNKSSSGSGGGSSFGGGGGFSGGGSGGGAR